ncbi:hypothetical protein VCHA34P112_260007 [Vibrio chagasii]|nr:hypothetical protein VCHA34P112_260007 [Vibrio chagasii]CAH7185141.1 hypothetical protein VCHA53O463_250007 [Vibrio chagasii]
MVSQRPYLSINSDGIGDITRLIHGLSNLNGVHFGGRYFKHRSAVCNCKISLVI